MPEDNSINNNEFNRELNVEKLKMGQINIVSSNVHRLNHPQTNTQNKHDPI